MNDFNHIPKKEVILDTLVWHETNSMKGYFNNGSKRFELFGACISNGEIN